MDPSQYYAGMFGYTTGNNPFANSYPPNNTLLDPYAFGGPQSANPQDMQLDSSDEDPASSSDGDAYTQRPSTVRNDYSQQHGKQAVIRAATEFLKRNNWSEIIMDDIEDFLHVLSSTNQILFSTDSIRNIAGYHALDIEGHALTEYIHPDDVDTFLRHFTSAVHHGTNLSVYYRLRKSDGTYVVMEVTGQPYYGESFYEGTEFVPGTPCKFFTAIARPYPSKSTAMVDSLLQIKIENENMKRKIEAAYLELENDPDALATIQSMNRSIRRSPSPELVPATRSNRSSVSAGTTSEPKPRKPKKSRTADVGEHHTCVDCGTSDSPEWRKGPSGPKTLCNACGLRYAKALKQGKINTEGQKIK